MKTLRLLALSSAAFLLTLLQSPAQGLLLAPFDPSIGPPTPTDLAATQVPISYSGGTFTAGGSAPPVLLGYTDPAGNSWGQIDTGSFVLTANINGSGNVTSGTLTVSATLQQNDPVLLTANLVTGPQGSPAGLAPIGSAWDYVNYYADGTSEHNVGDLGAYAGTLMAFSFTVTGGTLAGDFGASGIIELNPNGSDPFDLTLPYSNGGNYGTVDVIPIPEPSAILLFLMSGAVWSVARRSR
jgi:hypothetical protein